MYKRQVHDAAPLPLDIWIEDVQVCAAGAVRPYDEAALAVAVAGDERLSGQRPQV